MLLGSYQPITSQGARRMGLAGPLDSFNFDQGAILEQALGVGPDYIKNQLSLLEQLLVASTAASVGTFLFVLLKGR